MRPRDAAASLSPPRPVPVAASPTLLSSHQLRTVSTAATTMVVSWIDAEGAAAGPVINQLLKMDLCDNEGTRGKDATVLALVLIRDYVELVKGKIYTNKLGRLSIGDNLVQ